jgi:hypothetical protein
MSLPDPATAVEDERTVEMDAANAGQVRITYQRRSYRNGKFTVWHWVAVRADAA